MNTKFMSSHYDNLPTINITCPYEIPYPFINDNEETDRQRIDKKIVNQHTLDDIFDKLNSSDKKKKRSLPNTQYG